MTVPVVFALALFAVGGTTAGVVGWRAGRESERPGYAVRVPIPLQTYVEGAGSPLQVAISPDGRRIAFAERQPNGKQPMLIREVDELTSRILENTENARTPVFSPDGNWLVFLSGIRELRKVQVSGGPVIALGNVPGFRGMSWAPNGVIVASVGDTLKLIPDAGGEHKVLIRPDSATGELGQRSPRVLADGHTVIYQSWRGTFATSRIGVTTLGGRASRFLDLPGASPVGVVAGHLIYGNSAGSLMAVPFDVKAARLTGAPFPVAERVEVDASGLVRAAVSHSGSLVYSASAMQTQIIRNR
jgi:hypothetical protein